MTAYPFHKRADWAVLHPSFARLTVPVHDVFWHHTVSPYMDDFDARAMRALEQSEIGRGGYIALAYHTLFCGDGARVESRPANVQGGATINNNKTSIAVVVPGNYTAAGGDVLSIAQVDSVGGWIADCIKLGIVDRSYRVRAHSDVFATACPSDQVRWWIANGIRDVIDRHLHATTPAPAPSPSVPPQDWEGIRRAVIARAKVEVAAGPILKYRQPMMHSEEVRWWQHALAVTMRAPVEADGYFGTISRQWTMNWQRFWKIDVDGIVGPQSRRTMVFNLASID